MPGIDDMGIENASQGICGFTSTLYAVYQHCHGLRLHLDRALGGSDRVTRMQAEIKTFLRMMQADGNQGILDGITALTKTFPNYDTWTIDQYIDSINEGTTRYSIAMPPEAVVVYMEKAWELKGMLVGSDNKGSAILGLTRTGAPVNRWKNLAHYIYRGTDNKIYSWGEQFDSMEDMNKKKGKDYSVVYYITVG